MSKSIAGLLQVQLAGETYQALGNWTYNLGGDKREAIVGADGVHGYSVVPQVPFIDGEITDNDELDLAALQGNTDITVTVTLRNGKTIVLRNAWYAHEGTVSTEKSNIPIRFEGLSADEV